MMPPGFCWFNFIGIRAFEKPWVNSSEVPSIYKENADSTSESSSTSFLSYRRSYYSLQSNISKKKGSFLH